MREAFREGFMFFFTDKVIWGMCGAFSAFLVCLAIFVLSVYIVQLFVEYIIGRNKS